MKPNKGINSDLKNAGGFSSRLCPPLRLSKKSKYGIFTIFGCNKIKYLQTMKSSEIFFLGFFDSLVIRKGGPYGIAKDIRWF